MPTKRITGTTRGTTSGPDGLFILAIPMFVKDITMRGIVHQAVFLDMYYFSKAPAIADIYSGAAKPDTATVSEATPRFRDIHISNIVCDGAEEGIFVRGLPEMNYNTGAGLLFSINGAKCANIRVSGTELSKAVHNAAFYYGAAEGSLKNE